MDETKELSHFLKKKSTVTIREVISNTKVQLLKTYYVSLLLPLLSQRVKSDIRERFFFILKEEFKK